MESIPISRIKRHQQLCPVRRIATRKREKVRRKEIIRARNRQREELSEEREELERERE